MSEKPAKRGPAAGASEVSAAVNDMVSGMARDVGKLPQAAAQAAAFPAKRTLIPLLMAQFLNSYDTSSMNVAIGNIVSDLNTTVTGVQTALSLYTLVMAAGMITGSKLADIWGRRRTFTAGVIIYGTGALITALSPSLGVMIFGWSLLEGVGSVLMIPPIYILITVNYKDLKARAAAFGAVGAAAALGGASGPLLGGIITTAVSWRLSFALEVVAMASILLLRGRIVDAGVQGPKPKLDVIGAILSAIGMTALVFGALMAANYGWFTARQDFSIAGRVLIQEGGISPTILLMGIGVVVLLGFGARSWYQERHGKEPLVHLDVLLNRVAVPGLVTQTAQWFLSIGIGFIIAVFVQVTYGFNAIQTGLVMIPFILGLLVFARRSAQLAKKYPLTRIIQAGFVVTELGVIALLLMVDPTGSPWRFIPGLLLIGAGIGLINPASVNLVQSAVSEERQGDISGVSRSASNLGSSLGTALAGSVLVLLLVTGITQLTAESTVLPPEDKAQISAALENNVSAVSDTQVEAALAGQPEDIVQEVVRINAAARSRALAGALFALGVVGLIGLVATFFLPGRARREHDRGSGQDRTEPERDDRA